MLLHDIVVATRSLELTDVMKVVARWQEYAKFIISGRSFVKVNVTAAKASKAM